MAECDICFETFNAEEQRPKSLPCGHTFCLRCLLLQDKRCPVDRKAFRSAPAALPDNFKVLELSQRPAAIFGWCRLCRVEAKESCLDQHAASICSLRTAQTEKLGPKLDSLQAEGTAMTQLFEMMSGAVQEVQPILDRQRHRLAAERTRVAEERERLQRSMDHDPMIWVKTEPREEGDAVVPVPELASGSVGLLADLADPTASCCLTVFRGLPADNQPRGAAMAAAPTVSWRANVHPLADPVTRLYLCGLLCDGVLQQVPQHPHHPPLHNDGQEQQGNPMQLVKMEVEPFDDQDGADAGGEQPPQDRSNEIRVADADMALRMKVGSRVARGTHWNPLVKADGIPPGAGTVMQVTRTPATGDIKLRVRWDANNTLTHFYSMAPEMYFLSLLAKRPEPPVPHSDTGYLNLSGILGNAALQRKFPALAIEEVRVLVKLRCDASHNWSKKLLTTVSGRLEALTLIHPRQQHLKVASGMPALRVLHLLGNPVELEPCVDLTLDHVDPRAVDVPRDPVQDAREMAPLPRTPALQELYISHVLKEQLLQIPGMCSLRRLELHCPYSAPVPGVTFPTAVAPAGLKWLRLGVYPLSTAVALVRAHAATLEELELVAASKEPYGCPDLGEVLRDCGLVVLRRVVLWRGSSEGRFCQHEVGECVQQRAALHANLAAVTAKLLVVVCSDCSDIQERAL